MSCHNPAYQRYHLVRLLELTRIAAEGGMYVPAIRAR